MRIKNAYLFIISLFMSISLFLYHAPPAGAFRTSIDACVADTSCRTALGLAVGGGLLGSASGFVVADLGSNFFTPDPTKLNQAKIDSVNNFCSSNPDDKVCFWWKIEFTTCQAGLTQNQYIWRGRGAGSPTPQLTGQVGYCGSTSKRLIGTNPLLTNLQTFINNLVASGTLAGRVAFALIQGVLQYLAIIVLIKAYKMLPFI